MNNTSVFFHKIHFTVIIVIMIASAQPPDTVHIPVTFYDFHADPKTDDFENCTGRNRPGSVKERLDGDAKPVLKEDLNCTPHFDEWYRPQGAANATFDQNSNRWTGLVPYKNRVGEYVGSGYSASATLANVVIYDSLPFVYDEWTGLYVYENYRFFLLDDRGFGEEPSASGHNFAFTTEIQYRFVYVPGLVFDFVGDDDFWLFIDNQLALDLGGLQSRRRGSLDVDDVSEQLGLEYGKEYTFSIFHAERHTGQSNLKITTNLIMPPAYLFFYTDPGTPNTPENPALGPVDTISAGDTLQLYARLFDSGFNPITDRDSTISWEVFDTAEQVLSSDSGAHNSFVSNRAGTSVSIRATYIDPAFPDNPVIRVLVVYVTPGKPHHLSIETGSSPDRFTEGATDTLLIDSTETRKEVFAAVRDRYGNFLDMAEDPVWNLNDDCTLLNVESDSTVDGHAFVGRNENDSGDCQLHVSMDTLLPDSSFLIVRKMGVVTLSSALTRDRDGSGYLDAAELHFDRTVDAARDIDIDDIHVMLNGKERDVDSIGSGTGFADSVLFVYLRQDTGGAMQTDMTLKVTIDTIAFGNNPIRDFVAEDGAGPVIETAVLHSNNPDIRSDDRIYVTFSEPVLWKGERRPNETIFYYRKSARQNDAFDGLTQSDLEQQDTGAIIVMKNGYGVEPFQDLLQLRQGSGLLTDENGNGVVSDSRRAPIISNDKGIKAFAVENPFRPGKSTIPRSIISILGGNSRTTRYGTVLIVRPDRKIKRCYISIVDMFGNTVLKKTKMVNDEDTQKYYAIWNGRNPNGRFVGKGVYLLIATATLAENGKTVIDKTRIGVR